MESDYIKKNIYSLKKKVFLLVFLAVFSFLSPIKVYGVGEISPVNPALLRFKAEIPIRQRAANIKPTVPINNPNEKARNFLTSMAVTIAKLMVREMVNSTIIWANSGFEESPAYAINPKSYFLNLTDNVLGEFIANNSDLRFLCSPFRNAVRTSIVFNYYQPPQSYFSCPISSVGANIADFYQNFNQGGWQTWFEMTQNPSGNPYGAYITAQGEIGSRIQEKLDDAERQLNWNQGFLSWSRCLQSDPQTGECIKRDPNIRTPGSVIKSQLDNTMFAELNQIMSIDQFDQLLGALLGGVMKKYIFSPDGLFRSNAGADFSRGLYDLYDDWPEDYTDYGPPEPPPDDTEGGDGPEIDRGEPRDPSTPNNPGGGESGNGSKILN